MILLRSIVLNLTFYLNVILQMVLLSPYYFLAPRKKAWIVPKNWARSNNWLMAKIVGTTFEIEGAENLPEGAFIFAPKHQSFWDAFALLPVVKDPLIIVKRELMWIPMFGQYLQKLRMIPVNRTAKGKAMAGLIDRTLAEMATGRQLIIYPEGTRRPAGSDADYRFGIARLYRDLKVPVVPCVMHMGIFWPRRTFLRFPGHFKVRILPAIPPGLDADKFFARLVDEMETASDELLLKTIRENPQVPLSDIAAEKYAKLEAAEREAAVKSPN